MGNMEKKHAIEPVVRKSLSFEEAEEWEIQQHLAMTPEERIYYGYARLTGDIDFFYDRTEENCGRLYEALKEFWGGYVPEIKNSSEFLHPGLVWKTAARIRA